MAVGIRHIPVSSIQVSGTNVRKTGAREGLRELAANIHENGLLQPVVVYKKGRTHELIIGQRRFLACKEILKWDKIPARVIAVKNETAAMILSFSENIHRLDLGYRDKMGVAAHLREQLGSVKEVAEALGVSDQTVRNYLGYAGVPEKLRKMVDAGKIGATTANNIAKNIGDPKRALAIATKVVEEVSSDRKRAIIDVARENPKKPVAQVVQLARKRKYQKVTLNLTARVAGALQHACSDYRSEPTDLATEALTEWLDRLGYLA